MGRAMGQRRNADSKKSSGLPLFQELMEPMELLGQQPTLSKARLIRNPGRARVGRS